MPAVQAKIKFDAKNPTDGENLKTKIKDRNAHRKTEANWERLSQPKRKPDIVPELDFNSLFHKSQHKKVKGEAKKAPSTRTTAAKMSKKRQWEVGNAFSKLNLEHQQAKLLTHRSIQKSSRSNNYLSPKQKANNLLVDVENINPNELSDNFFECNDGDAFFRTQYPDFESFAEYDFQTPNLFEDFELPSVTSLESSATKKSHGVLRHFKELLRQEETSKTNLLGQSEVALLKDIVKADERHQQLRKDDYKLLKEILMGQLKEISQQERVIKIALKKILGRRNTEVEVTNLKVDTAERPMEDTILTPKGISDRTNRSDSAPNPRQQVDVIFKNVPSLEKEIRILRSLGLKLEETLKMSERKVSAREKQRRNIILYTTQVIYFIHCVGITTFRVTSKAIQIVNDIAQEFQIRLQTINELRLEKEFFIPKDLDKFTLQRTNFDKLSRSPELLLRRLKPFTKDSKVKFNLIEQDPIFFNHFLSRMCKIYSETVDSREAYIPKPVDSLRLTAGGGDQPDIAFTAETQTNLELPPALEKKISSKDSLTQKKKKRAVRQRSKPLLEDTQVTAKNRLFRIVLIGAVQLSLLFMVISAILYPEAICII